MRCLRMIMLGCALATAACNGGGGGGSQGGGAGGGVADGDPPVPEGPAGVAPDPTSTLFVLGDSLSDIGNAAGLADYLLGGDVWPPTSGLCHPTDVLVLQRSCDELLYGRSRVSNGPVAVEYLTSELGLDALEPSLHLVPDAPVSGTNYAIAGGKARAMREIDLTQQVNFLLLEHAPLPSDALYVVMIGGNDLIDALQAGAMAPGQAPPSGQSETADQIVSAAVAAIGSNVTRLLDNGARRLVVANVPDLADLPAVQASAAGDVDQPARLAEATAITEAFNTQLAARLDELAASGPWQAPTPAVIARFDLRAALTAARIEAAANGRNADTACFESEAYQATAVRNFHPDCAPVNGGEPRFAQFVFWDDIHPAATTHAAIASALIDLL